MGLGGVWSGWIGTDGVFGRLTTVPMAGSAGLTTVPMGGLAGVDNGTDGGLRGLDNGTHGHLGSLVEQVDVRRVPA